MKPLVFGLVIIFCVLKALAAREFVMKLVGVVAGKTITTRDVEASYLIDRALFNDGLSRALPALGTQSFQDASNKTIIEKMVNEEAVNFGVAKLSDAEIEQNFNLVKQRLNSPALKNNWAKINYSDSQLREIVAKKLRANHFIKYKTDSSFVQVSDEEAREYFNKNRLRFGTMEFESFKGSIKKYLTNKNAEDRLRDWFEILKKKHKVKNLISSYKNAHPTR